MISVDPSNEVLYLEKITQIPSDVFNGALHDRAPKRISSLPEYTDILVPVAFRKRDIRGVERHYIDDYSILYINDVLVVINAGYIEAVSKALK
jgi:hypothetical protein